MIRIAITPAAFDAIASTLPLGFVAFEAEVTVTGTGESMSDAIMRLVEAEQRPDQNL